MKLQGMIASLVDLNTSSHYVHWGFIQISVANLIVIALMILVFVIAVVVPFHVGRRDR